MISFHLAKLEITIFPLREDLMTCLFVEIRNYQYQRYKHMLF